MIKSVLLGGIFLLPVLAGFSVERGLRRRWEEIKQLRQKTAAAVLLLENSRKPLEREMKLLQQGAEGETLRAEERELLKEFVQKAPTASRGELLLLGREAAEALRKAEEEAENAYKSRGRLCRALGLVGGSGILLLLL